MVKSMTDLQWFANDNHIEEFVHFTNERNLLSILKRGVLSRKTLQENGIAFEYNDELRLDCMTEAISLSVTSPNYRMFYKYRMKKAVNWVVIAFDAQKLLRYNCSFYRTNAGSVDSHQFEKEDRRDLKSFEEMFSDWDPYHSRYDMGLGNNEPTDPQAEILVFDAIQISCISRIVFQNENQLKTYSPYLVNLGLIGVCGNYFFSPRRDYRYWNKAS